VEVTHDATAPRGASATTWRLALAFGAVLALFGMALLVTLGALARITDAEGEVSRLDHAKHAGHMAAAQVREQYIHQAHTLLAFDRSHMGNYDEAVTKTEHAARHLGAIVDTDEDRAAAGEIARLAHQSDALFRAEVLPAIDRGDRATVTRLGDRLEAVVDCVVGLNEALNARLEARSEAARQRAISLQRSARTATLACFALAIALAGIVGFWLARSILGPVQALRGGVRRVADGDLSARLEVARKDEFGELAAAFNQMAASLAHKQEQLVRSQKLASIGQVAAGVAHEINNPLGVILGYAKLLRRQATGETAEELRLIEEEAVQCQRIVAGLLDLARPQVLRRERFDLAELAREAVARLDDGGKLAERAVDTSGLAATTVSGDGGKLRQVIANLIVNAAEASPAGGRIAVTCGVDGGEPTLVVRDDGAGIQPDIVARIFDPFFTTKRGGTGLGLAITQAIVDAHGGRLEVDSRPGHGTTVRVRLPAKETSP
jgi:signal transduction histidine kinase